MDSAEDELINKLLLQVVDDHALGTQGQGLLLNSFKVLLLADVCKEALFQSQNACSAYSELSWAESRRDKTYNNGVALYR